MTEFRLKRRLRGEWRWVVIPIIIFLSSILVFIYVLQEPIILTSLILGYIGIVLFLMLFVKIFYGKKRFLTVYKIVLHPLFGPLILFISLATFNLVVGFIWIFFLALFASFVTYAGLHSLRKKKHPLQTAWIYQLSQKFRWYLLLAFGVMIANSIWLSVVPLLKALTEFSFVTMYLLLLGYYFIISFFATLGFFIISDGDIRRYCEMGLTEVRKGLEFCCKGGYRKKKDFIKNYLRIFSTVVNEFNSLVEKDYPNLLPNIPDSDLYVKALFASAVMDKPRLEEPKEGIKQMIEALKVNKPREPINFTGFIGGLCVIAGEKQEFSRIPKAFKIRPTLGKSFSKIKSPAVFVGIIAIFVALFSVYVTVRVSAPEVGYEWAEDTLGEDIAKLLFPIGEANIELQVRYVELSLWSGNRFNGQGYGEYSFQIKNEHRKNIEIENVSVTGPESITWIDINAPGNIKELVKVQIKGSEIRTPADRIIHKDSREHVTIALTIDYDLRVLEEYLEEVPTNYYLNIYGGGVQISVSYEIWGTGLGRDISKSMVRNHTDNFNFIFSPVFF